MREKEINDIEYLVEEDYINLSDLVLVATLDYFDCKYVATKKDPKPDCQRVEFVYKKSRETEKIIDDFWRGGLKVDPKRFWDIVRALKSKTNIY